MLERVTYSAYGVARHHWLGDVDGDGDVDSADVALVNAAIDESIGDAGYRAEFDLNRDGSITLADRGLMSAATALPEGVLSSTAVGNQIGYCGYVFAPETQSYLVRFRWYLPPLGRWGQRDPMGYVDGMSLYESVRSDPIVHRDPFGQHITDDELNYRPNGPGLEVPNPTRNCKRLTSRWAWSTPESVSRAARRIGFYGAKFLVDLNYRRCEVCCPSGATASTIDLDLEGLIELEVGTQTYDFWVGHLRLGWYARARGGGRIGIRVGGCGGGNDVRACFTMSAEAGLIADLQFGRDRGGKRLQEGGSAISVGARGGVNVQGTICISCGSSRCDITVQGCIGLRARAWATVEVNPFGYSVQKQWFWEAEVSWCSDEILLGSFAY